MAIPKGWAERLGSWKGTSKLHRSWLAADRQVSPCESSLHLDADARRAYATLVYVWEVDKERQEGTMLLAYAPKAKRLEIGWSDSWHQSTGVMHLSGVEAEDGSFLCKGTYEAEGQTWGWTIALALTDDHLTLKMANVTPDGESEWAVDATYRRDHG